MTKNAASFVQGLSNNGKAVGFIPGGVVEEVVQAWNAVHGDSGVLRVRLPYQPGRKDRQLAAVLLLALGRPPLARGVSTASAWQVIAGQCAACGCRLVVIENGDLLDKDSLAYIHRRLLPAVILVGGERLAQRIAGNTGWAGGILSWSQANH